MAESPIYMIKKRTNPLGRPAEVFAFRRIPADELSAEGFGRFER